MTVLLHLCLPHPGTAEASIPDVPSSSDDDGDLLAAADTLEEEPKDDDKAKRRLAEIKKDTLGAARCRALVVFTPKCG